MDRNTVCRETDRPTYVAQLGLHLVKGADLEPFGAGAEGEEAEEAGAAGAEEGGGDGVVREDESVDKELIEAHAEDEHDSPNEVHVESLDEKHDDLACVEALDAVVDEDFHRLCDKDAALDEAQGGPYKGPDDGHKSEEAAVEDAVLQPRLDLVHAVLLPRLHRDELLVRARHFHRPCYPHRH